MRKFLIDNALFLCAEYHADGIRYDEVSVIDRFGCWHFCQDLTSTLASAHPAAMNLAEYWSVNPVVVEPPGTGAGFDSTLTDGLRIALRRAIREASYPGEHPVDVSGLLSSLWPQGFAHSWQSQGRESRSGLPLAFADDEREDRIAHLADPSNPHSWFARSRARVAMGITLTAPGIPMMFMGQSSSRTSNGLTTLTRNCHLLGRARSVGPGHARFRLARIGPLRRDHPGCAATAFARPAPMMPTSL
jgi:1,4-alpha-glucan branching enzyme